MSKPLVSICCLTYNHEPYIRECLDGFLMQQTNFDFEVIIHDDASTDETKAIIEEYTQNYPDVIFPMYQTENQYSKGVRGIMARFNFPRCRGKYIALCEGDDYWTDPQKLQRQVDFLEANINFPAVSHNSKVIGLEERNFNEGASQVFLTDDLLNFRLFHTNTLLFRATPETLLDLSHIRNILSGDRMLFLIVSKYGGIAYSDEIMSVYRKNDGGISKNVNYKDLKKDLQILKILDRIEVQYNKGKAFKFIHYTLFNYSTKKLTWFEKIDYLAIKIKFDLKNKQLNVADYKRLISLIIR